MSSSSSVSPAENKPTKAKISYRIAKPSDVSAIAGLLNSVFEDDQNGEEQRDNDDDATTNGKSSATNADADADGNNTFMWDSLTEKNSEPQLSPKEQLELIEGQLAKRMMDAKKEDSLPHSFLIATIPSVAVSVAANDDSQEEDQVIGFLEMGTLPPPVSNPAIASVELPYIGNVAVSNDVRRRKVGSTLVRLATKIASKWCAPSPETSTPSFPPFLFLSVERENRDALKFYERLGFEELKVAKVTIEKIYLAQQLE